MELTQKYLHEALNYDPATGIFTWKADRPRHHFGTDRGHKIWRSNCAGKVAGTIHYTHGGNYHKIRLGAKQYLSHRLAFLYMTGEMPENVDHYDGDTTNDQWENLRKADRGINMRNRKPAEKAGALPLGVYEYRVKKSGGVRYFAIGTCDGVRQQLYRGDDMFEAIAARKSWESYHLSVGKFTERHFARTA